jgi:hypothetical protein
MAGKLPMGQKELLRGKLMEMVKQGKMSLKTAAGQLKISYRQGKRRSREYRSHLITMIDDAAKTRLSPFFEEETAVFWGEGDCLKSRSW